MSTATVTGSVNPVSVLLDGPPAGYGQYMTLGDWPMFGPIARLPSSAKLMTSAEPSSGVVPVSVAVDAILGGLAAGQAQVYVPEYFAGIAADKAQDVEKFLKGTAAYLRQKAAGA